MQLGRQADASLQADQFEQSHLGPAEEAQEGPARDGVPPYTPLSSVPTSASRRPPSTSSRTVRAGAGSDWTKVAENTPSGRA